MLDLITNAITKRQCLSINYYPGARIIEPHCLGRGEDGQLLLRAYQISGASGSGEHANWKLFLVHKCSIIEPANQNFDGPRPDYNPRDKIMKRGIICAL